MKKKVSETRSRAEVFNDYEGYVEKFKRKRTTDDTYTPPAVFAAVEKWVRERVPEIAHLETFRPFYPEGDYTAEDYTGRVVIDNPPFSILAGIKRFYIERGVPFFLFAPHLTLFTGAKEHQQTYIVTDYGITYDNGANVNTPFVSNLFHGVGVLLAPSLHQALRAAEGVDERKKLRTQYMYPRNVITAARLGKYVARGADVQIRWDEMQHVGILDNMRQLKSRSGRGVIIFGGGFFIPDGVANELESYYKEGNDETKIQLELSEREREIIERLNKAHEE